MKLQFTYLLFGALLCISACNRQPANFTSDADRKADSLLSLMTLDEKIGQLTLFTSSMDQTGPFIQKDYENDIKEGKTGAIFNAYGVDYVRHLQELAVNNTRLRIPLIFGYDVIHGHQTIFPIPLAEAASWDLKAIETSARVAASEASAQGLNWTFAPMCDIARDPRWGRIAEGSGEDPYLGSAIARARVRGFQGQDLKGVNTVAACVKHYAAYGAAQAGRDYHSVDMSERMLRETYLPAYKAAIDEGAATVMSSFNDLNGIPATMNKFLLTDILRNEWKFKGFVVSDYGSIKELIMHGTVADLAEASKMSLEAGTDMDMQGTAYYKELGTLVKEKKIDEKYIDQAARRILRVKLMLGLFDDPYRYCSNEREKAEVMKPENLEASRDVAKRTMVLLKNENSLLPLDKNIKTIAVIGPLTDAKEEMLGCWSAAGDSKKSVSIIEGIKAKAPSAEILYAKGCDINDDITTSISQAINVAKKADVVVLAVGEAAQMSGEAASRADLNLPGVQQQLVEAVYKTGKPIVVVLINGRPLTITWIDSHIPAILEAWFPGTEAGNAIADVLFGDYNPSGKLPVTFPRAVGQIPVFYSMKNTGRPFEPDDKYTSKYLDITNDPLYVFGYGLSYTTFEYSNLTLDKTQMSGKDSLQVKVTVKNTGKYKGEEVVQLYIHDKVASAEQPVRLLKGFTKIELAPGEAKDVTFCLKASDLAFYRADMSFGCEAGGYTVFVGGNSRDTKNVDFNLTLPL
jgi:beta-glucosidase